MMDMGVLKSTGNGDGFDLALMMRGLIFSQDKP